jgi:phosphohistidine phosphatase
MKLLLIRHALARPAQEGEEDASRPLTARGRRRFRQAVQGLDRIGLRPQLVLHSPYLRAEQTAAMLCPLSDPRLVPCAALAAAPELSGLQAALEGEAVVAMVGHEPWMGELLLQGQAAGAAFPFRKGGVAVLEGDLEAGAMQLRALLPPRLLRALGRT